MAIDRVRIRTMEERDLDAADRVCRAAFDAFIGGDNVFGDRDYVYSRWRAAPDQALVATIDDEVVGSNFVARWGSVGVFGPLSVHPDRWDRGIAQELMAPTVDLLDGWETTHQGLFTFPHSAKHIGIYQRFGFWPGHLTAVMSKPVSPGNVPRTMGSPPGTSLLEACRTVAEQIYPGLNLSSEIRAVVEQELGEVMLVGGGDEPRGFAVCHIGGDTEAGSATLYVKFAAVAPGPDPAGTFGTLLDAAEAAAARAGCQTMVAGVNTARIEPYQVLLGRGFRAGMYGVAMLRGDPQGYNSRGTYLIDDWR